MQQQLYFIGAGPGDPDLITVKGKKIIMQADIIIYAGSLVNFSVLEGHKEQAVLHNSATMTLEEILEVMIKGVRDGKIVARVHSGDPSIYGAIREQMSELEKHGISYTIIPGVSSFVAAVAALQKEYTLPGVSQTIILTRQEGRIPVPEGQDLASLAQHNASMVVFLSVHMIEKVVKELKVGYPGDTPVIVVQRVSWPDAKTVTGTLDTIAEKVKEEKINKTALILVGNFLGNAYELSKLYDKSFSHAYRSAHV